MNDHLMKVLYFVVGILVVAIIGLNYLSKMYDTHQAYKFPARTVTKKEVKTVYEKVKEQTDIIATGNSRVETRPDGIQIVYADRIELHSKKDTATTEHSTATDNEQTKPIFQDNRRLVGGVSTTLDGQTQQVQVTYFLFDNIGITISEPFSLSRLELKLDAAHTFVGIAVKF